MKILYLVPYTHKQFLNDNRVTYPSSLAKCQYITRTLAKLGHDVTIVSSSPTKNKLGFFKKRIGTNEDNIKFILGPTFGARTNLGKIFQKLFSRVWLFFFLLSKKYENTIVIVYHSLSLIKPILWSRFFKKYKFLLEVEEIYGSFSVVNSRGKKRENKYLQSPDRYIFSCESLERLVNLKKKPYIISYGSYLVNEHVKKEWGDGRIHIVYAGTLDAKKGGCYNAIKAASFLPKNYVLHVLGFGTEFEIDKTVEAIECANKQNAALIEYDGCLYGDEYDELLSKCSVGLSTQKLNGSFNNTSFPSKILVYLSHGLKVVAPKIDVLVESKLNNILFLYDEEKPESIAKTIIAADESNSTDGKHIIVDLDNDFLKDIGRLVNF